MFNPMPELGEPPLQGFRSQPDTGQFTRWQPDDHGRLFSEVLGLWLEPHEGILKAVTQAGEDLPTYEELDAAYQREVEARRALEAELSRLRARQDPEGQRG